MNMQPRDATTALLRAIAMNFMNFRFTVDGVISRSWASATFTGARHELTFRVEGDGARAAADAFLADLSAAEFQLRGHIMAEIALLWEERVDGQDWVRIALEALTVEDC
jgi:hypothetical protein